MNICRRPVLFSRATGAPPRHMLRAHATAALRVAALAALHSHFLLLYASLCHHYLRIHDNYCATTASFSHITAWRRTVSRRNAQWRNFGA